MSAQFFQAVEARRTYYALSKDPILSNEKLKDLLETAVKYAPSAFNSQTGRAILLVGDQSDKVWKIAGDLYLGSVKGNEPVYNLMKGKIEGYKSGYGTIVYFEDQDIIKGLASKMAAIPLEVFQTWSENSTGMLQYIVWAALEAEGYGASLQHHAAFHPDINGAINKEFGLPESWKCTALMPFGKPNGPPGVAERPKTFEPLEERVKVFA